MSSTSTITSQMELPPSILSPIRDVAHGSEPPASVSDTDSAFIVASPIIRLDTVVEISWMDELTNSLRSVGASSLSSSPPSTPQEEHVSPEEVQVKRPESLEDPEKSLATHSNDAIGLTLASVLTDFDL